MLLTTILDALRSLWSSKQRTMLATIGIVIGSGSVIAMINIGQIVQLEAIKSFQKMGPEVVTLTFDSTIRPVSAEAFDASARRAGSIALAAPMAASGQQWYFDGLQGNAAVIGTHEELFPILGTSLAAGRYINRFDGNQPFVLVGAGLLESGQSSTADDSNSARDLQPGDQLTIGDTAFTVTGVLEPHEFNPLLGFSVDMSVFVPIMAIRRLGADATVATSVARVRQGNDIAAAGAAFEEQLRQDIPGVEVDALVAEQMIEAMQEQSRLMSLLLGAMGSISLLVGGIGIMNVMLVAVTERRREIGLRLAVGATPQNIVWLFLVEACLLTTSGGILGLGLGIGGAHVAADISGLPYHFSPLAVILGVGVSSAIGVFFGYYPARVASSLNPIDALNAE